MAAVALLLTRSAPSSAADRIKEECVKASESGQSLQLAGRLAAAREQFLVCAAARCPSVLRDDCAQRLDDIKRAQPSIVFEAKDGSGHDLSEVKVSVDGRPLADRLDGTGLVVDPGEHTFSFQVVGQPELTRKLVLYEGEKSRREVIVFGSKPVERAPPPAAPASAASSAHTPENPAVVSTPGWTGRKTVALVTAGLGAAGIAVGAIFGVDAIGKNNQSNADGHCDSTGCDPAGKQLRNDALSAATVSTIAFGAGAALFLGGVVLWLTAPSANGSPSTSVALGAAPTAGGAAVSLRAQWP
jgi:hypothetical protein